MRKSVPWMVVTVVLVLACAGGSSAGESKTLTGEYVWFHNDNPGDLEAVFTPTGERTWDVAFHFNFRGTPHTYSGTAEGSLREGELKGTVKNKNKRRTFTFRGSIEGGEFTGTHSEVTSGTEHSTGTLTLSH